MHITIIHPAIGHKKQTKYIRTWQMESLPAATIAGLMPSNVSMSFFDDRMETIPYDIMTDAVVISVETYTAKRAYQIASEYRKRGIPVIMGGFHPTLMPDEVKEYAEAIVIGEAELIWHEVIEDLRHKTLKRVYHSQEVFNLRGVKPDRSIFQSKRYLPIGLIETGRGCPYACDFCAVASFFHSSHRNRPLLDIVSEIKSIQKEKNIFFFVDDNFIGNMKRAKELLRALIPLKIRWITQMSIDCAYDEELLDLMNQSGCMGILIGFETLNKHNLALMNKKFNTKHGDYTTSLEALQKYAIRIYATFVFGYDYDTPDSFEETLQFAIDQKFYIAAFNHLTPFPATPLYEKLKKEGRLVYEKWWLDEKYRYNDLPFQPKHLLPEEITKRCVDARRQFYSFKSILTRLISKANYGNFFMLRNYFPINWMHRYDVDGRNGYPLGDENFKGTLMKVRDNA